MRFVRISDVGAACSERPLSALTDPGQARSNSKQTPIPICEETIAGNCLNKVADLKSHDAFCGFSVNEKQFTCRTAYQPKRLHFFPQKLRQKASEKHGNMGEHNYTERPLEPPPR